MKTQTSQAATRRRSTVLVCASLACALLLSDAARAGNRVFLVTLANSPKQYPGPSRAEEDGIGVPTGGLISAQSVRDAYFDRLDPDLGSFAEYWEEVSYGDVTITGEVTDWLSLPWPFQPLLVYPSDDSPQGPSENAARYTPDDFFDLDGDGQYSYGHGELFMNERASISKDLNGDPNGLDDGPWPFEQPGSSHVSQGGLEAGHDVWKPGERFVDVDGDGKWDGLDENNNWMDHDGDNVVDLRGPWIDLNRDGEPQAPQGCEYLDDSDNDGNPDCCPNGPGVGAGFSGCRGFPFDTITIPGPFGDETYSTACPATTWSTPQGTIVDCNGNLIDDTEDIATGVSKDEWPYTANDEGDACVPGDGDGIPDECQYQVIDEDGGLLFPFGCREEGELQCDQPEPEDNDPCCDVDPCIELEEPRTAVQRCEYDDSTNFDRRCSLVEPFENFLRRWDPCYYDPVIGGEEPGGISPENAETDRVHWIKVYDPFSSGVVTCDDPGPFPVGFAYASSTAFQPEQIEDPDEPGQFIDNPLYAPSYIQKNYPGDWQALEAEAQARPVFGLHDPWLKLPESGPSTCRCLLDCDGNLVFVHGEPDFAECGCDVDGDGSVSGEESGYCFAGLHADYNPPDRWFEATPHALPDGTIERTTKMRAAPGTNYRMKYIIATPEPGALGAADQESWFADSWSHRYELPRAALHSSLAASTPPSFPTGFDPNTPPSPGMTPGVKPNTPRFEPWNDLDPDTYVAAENRRYFNANFGGLDGRGGGWTGLDMEVLRWETGLHGIQSFEDRMNARILPEEIYGVDAPGAFYDGWVEHDDLPSSKYHLAGDQRLGEITSPWRTWFDVPEEPGRRIPQIWGDDLGSGQLGDTGPGGGDQMIPAAGPYATGIHGTMGRDAGNTLITEWLTWRTNGSSPSYGYVWETYHGTAHPYAGPGGLLPNENLGFRDYNLDGMIDQGEVRPAGSANYLADSFNGTPNNGVETEYPFNRRRLVEDCVEILDEILDFDDFVDPVAMARVACPGTTLASWVPIQFGVDPHTGHDYSVVYNGILSGIVLVPDGAAAESTTAPTPNAFNRSPWYYPIHNEDSDDAEDMFPAPNDYPDQHHVTWNLAFHDLVYPLDGPGEVQSGAMETGDLQTAFSAHEYFHSWEGYPDLYDYDVYGEPGLLINCPIGVFDIMAYGGLVHPVPILKEMPCTEWINPTDLVTVVTPGVPATITFPAAEFVRDDSYYFIENEVAQGQEGAGERYYIWSAGLGFDEAFPGAGLLIMHTDTGSNPGALPPQQGSGTRFTYKIIQADGEDELSAGPGVDPGCGDAGDLWPGSEGNVEFGFDTNPPARWYAANSWIGLEITDIRPDGSGSVAVDLVWVPTTIPSLEFIDPPGGVSVGDIYSARARATDVYGGTLILFYYGTDPNDYQQALSENLIDEIKKTNPGTFELSRNWNIKYVEDNRYYLYAELIPGEGAGGTEKAYLEPRPGRNNVGTGSLEVTHVDTSAIKLKSRTGEGGWFSEVTLHDPLTSIDFSILDELWGGSSAPPPFQDYSIPLRAMTLRILDGENVTIFDDNDEENTTFSFWRIDSQRLGLAYGANPCTGDGPCEIHAYQIYFEYYDDDDNLQEWIVLDRQPPTPSNPSDHHAMVPTFYGFVAWSERDFVDAGVVPGKDRLIVAPFGGKSEVRLIEDILGDSNYPSDMRTLELVSSLLLGHEGQSAGGWRVISLGAARFETWTAFCVDIADGKNDFVVYGNLTQPEPPDDAEDQDPYPHLLVDRTYGATATYTSLGGEVTFEVEQGATPFGLGDSFTFTTTGITAASKGVTVFNGAIKEGPTAVIVAGPLEGRAPLTVSFDGRDSFDPNGDPLSYRWSFDDGSPPATGPVVSHTFNQSRTFTVSLRVTNQRNGLYDVAYVDIIIANNTPNAMMTAEPTSGPTPLTVRFSGSASSDTETSPGGLVYEWDFGDGTAAGNGEAGEFVNVEHFYSNDGLYTAVLTVTDEGGKQDKDSIDILVGNTRPVPNIYPTPLRGPVPHEVVFNAIASYDAEDSNNPDIDPTQVLKVTWSWDDGTADETWPIAGANGATDGSVPHTFTKIGSYEVGAVITDSEGASTAWGGATVTVTELVAGSSDPKAIFTIDPDPPLLGEEFTVNAILSFDTPAGGQITSYDWTFGDDTTASGKTAKHTYNAEGTYTITLIVTDDETPPNTNSTSKTYLVTAEGSSEVEEENTPPSAILIVNPQTGVAGVTSFSFDGSRSTDVDEGDEQALTYSWSFGDRTTAEGPEVEHVYQEAGRYLVRLTVRDPQNGSSTASQQIVVSGVSENRSPQAFITTGPRRTTVGGSLTFNGSTSFDQDGDALNYKWEFKLDGEMVAEPTGVEVTQTFVNDGTYTVELIVTDPYGAVGRSGLDWIVVTARVEDPNVNDNDGTEPEPEQPLDGDSSDQRPRFCAFGMLQSLCGMLLGLSAMLAGRRRWL